MNELLRGELSAVETYQQVLEKVRGEPEGDQIQKILNDHMSAVATLQEHIRMFGDKPEETSGAWGAFAKTITASAKLFGDVAALKALKEGEEHGMKEYRKALNDEGLAPMCRQMIISTFMPRQADHISVIDRLMKTH